jgi:riboflavin kinase / FMN adenylyltransferase
MDLKFSGKVIPGSQKGKGIGFPTINLMAEIDLPFGVYACNVLYNGSFYKGALHYGARPALKDDAVSLEIHILDFNADLYGETITVQVYNKLRDIMNFDSFEALRDQIKLDVDSIRKMNF